MKVEILNREKLSRLDCGSFSVPFLPDRFAFYVERDGEQKDVKLMPTEDGFAGTLEDLYFALSYRQKQVYFLARPAPKCGILPGEIWPFLLDCLHL